MGPTRIAALRHISGGWRSFSKVGQPRSRRRATTLRVTAGVKLGRTGTPLRPTQSHQHGRCPDARRPEDWFAEAARPSVTDKPTSRVIQNDQDPGVRGLRGRQGQDRTATHDAAKIASTVSTLSCPFVKTAHVVHADSRDLMARVAVESSDDIADGCLHPRPADAATRVRGADETDRRLCRPWDYAEVDERSHEGQGIHAREVGAIRRLFGRFAGRHESDSGQRMHAGRPACPAALITR